MTQTEAIEFGCWCGKNGIWFSFAWKLAKWARGLRTLAEVECNLGELSPAQQKREARLRRDIGQIAKEAGLLVRFAGDPRGGIVYLWQGDGETSYDLARNRYAL